MKKSTGAIGIILGGLSLSLEIYMLKVIQSLEMIHGEWCTSAWDYAGEPPCTIALILTASIIIFSLVIFYTKKN